MQRTITIALAAIAILLTAFVVVYTFGTPQTPEYVAASEAATAPAPSATPVDITQPADAAGQGQPPVGGEVVEGEVPEPDPKVPLAIEIPGCKCHSDDPKLVKQHAKYRMNQCGGCHEGVPQLGW